MSKREPLSKSERDFWKELHLNTHACARRRAKADETFAALFPKGHETSIGSLVRDYAESQDPTRFDEPYGYLRKVHPRAFALIAKYGQDFVPSDWDEATYRDKQQPTRRGCCRDSWVFMRSFNTQFGFTPENRLAYVEGIAWGVLTRPMLHAWNVQLSQPGLAFDWSHYATSKWTRYFGIPFTQEELDRIIARFDTYPGDMRLLFFIDNFPSIESFLTELLERRNEKPAE